MHTPAEMHCSTFKRSEPLKIVMPAYKIVSYQFTKSAFFCPIKLRITEKRSCFLSCPCLCVHIFSANYQNDSHGQGSYTSSQCHKGKLKVVRWGFLLHRLMAHGFSFFQCMQISSDMLVMFGEFQYGALASQA